MVEDWRRNIPEISDLLKALYISLAFPHNEEVGGPISTWYNISQNNPTGMFFALNTPELGLSPDDLRLFSSFKNLLQRIDLTQVEIADAELYR